MGLFTVFGVALGHDYKREATAFTSRSQKIHNATPGP